MRLTMLDKYIQHSAKQNSFIALREWTTLPWGPSHDSTTCTSWPEAVPFLLCLLVVELLMCVSLRLCFYLYCCFMFVCSGKGVLLAKVGTAFPNVSAWVSACACVWFFCLCLYKFSVPGWVGVFVFVFVFVYLRRWVCLDKVGSAFPIVPAWVTLGRRLPACCKWPCVP